MNSYTCSIECMTHYGLYLSIGEKVVKVRDDLDQRRQQKNKHNKMKAIYLKNLLKQL